MKKLVYIISLLIISLLIITVFSSLEIAAASPRQMEKLDRGLVAVQTNNGIFISWRLLGTEDMNTGFNVSTNYHAETNS